MKYSYQSKNFGYIGQPDVKTFREVLESFGMTEKEIGEIIMDCERKHQTYAEFFNHGGWLTHLPDRHWWLGKKSQDREKSE